MTTASLGYSDHSLSGYYGQVTWFLTSDRRPYSVSEGEFGRVVPTRSVGAVELGLRYSVVGFSDITPFVVSLLQGSFGIGDRQILQAVVIASASNNLLKTVYTYAFGDRRTAHLAGPGMLGLAALSMIYAVVAL